MAMLAVRENARSCRSHPIMRAEVWRAGGDAPPLTGGRNAYQSRPRRRIVPNHISGDGMWCSFALSDDLMSKLTVEGIFLMKTQRSVLHALVRGSAGGAHRRRTGFLRSRATRVAVALGLALGGAGATVAALASGGGPATAAHANTHHARNHSLATGSGGASQRAATPSTSPSIPVSRPFMY